MGVWFNGRNRNNMKNNELTFDERMKRLEIVWFKTAPPIVPKPKKRKRK